jgi:hypothetical protein
MCPSQTRSASGSNELTDCKCRAGYTAASDGVACGACNAGAYKVATGTGQCSTCPVGTSSASGSNELTDCKCRAGYTAASDGVACGACDAGAYKVATGTGDCSACLAGTSSSASGSTELTDCTDCLAGTYSSGGKSSCTDCLAGTYFTTVDNVDQCASCAAGTSSAAGAADATSCTDCLAGTYSAVGAGECTACPQNMNSDKGAKEPSDCKCKAGTNRLGLLDSGLVSRVCVEWETAWRL